MNLKELQILYPLSAQWSDIQIFEETCSVGDAEIFLLGLATTSKENGSLVTASAGGTEPAAIAIRGYLELLERVALVEASSEPGRQWSVSDERGNCLKELPGEIVFRGSSSPENWKYSLSNGVAAAFSFERAAVNAACELFERDAVLKSWFGSGIPRDAQRFESSQMLEARKKMASLYDFRSVLFTPEKGKLEKYEVAGVFAFPKDKSLPFAYGFGSRFGITKTIDHAFGECVQRMGFLYGEEFEQESLQFEPTAQYHQSYYMIRENQEMVHHWLDGRNAKSELMSLQGERPRRAEGYVDMTPENLRGRVSVVKAMDSHLLPLVFGKDYEEVLPEGWRHAIQGRFIHPIA